MFVFISASLIRYIMRMYNYFENEIKHFSPDAFIKMKSNMEKQGLPSFNNEMLEYTHSLICYKLITIGFFFHGRLL